MSLWQSPIAHVVMDVEAHHQGWEGRPDGLQSYRSVTHRYRSEAYRCGTLSSSPKYGRRLSNPSWDCAPHASLWTHSSQRTARH